MKVLISGSSGLVGSALCAHLAGAGWTVERLVRGAAAGIRWDPSRGEIDAGRMEGFDTVVHLAGDNIAEGRWTPEKKERIRSSRVAGTALLASTLAKLEARPKNLICASAIGYYGDRGTESLTEESAPGSGYLPDVCREWETASMPAEKAGIRVACLRFGVILTPRGGALKKMLLPFRMGVGGRVGSGRQYMSWVSLEDVVRAIEFAATCSALKGPVNVVADQPVTNAEFTRILGRVLSRPTIFPMPEFAARLAFGEMADALLLASARVLPAKLKAAGFSFKHFDLERSLRSMLC
ncbi:MAG: TIGR01777 family oxidoreductase [Candidatus Hydrogenedentota bacterium]